MAIENAKTLNVRIKNKYDSYENWVASGLVLEAGEIAIAYTTVDVQVENGTAKHPALLMKVGNGTDTFKDLPWLSAKAADVLAVCKNEDDLKGFINGVIANAGIATNDALQTLSGKVSTAEGKITTLEGKMTAVEGKAADNESAIAALELLVGDESVKTQIETYVTELNLGDTYAAKSHTHEMSEVNGLSDAIATAKKAGTDAATALSEYKTLNDAAVKVNTDAIAGIKNGTTIDNFAEVETALAGKQAAGNYSVEGHKHEIADVNGLSAAIEGAAKAGTDAAATAESNAKAYAKEYADGLAGNYDATGSAAAAEKNAKDYTDSEMTRLVGDTPVATQISTQINNLKLSETYDAKGAAAAAETAAKGHADSLNTAMNTRVEALEAIDHDHENKDVLDGITAEKVAAWDTAEQNAKDYADELDGAMDERVLALEAKFGDGEGNVEAQIEAAVAAEAALREAADTALDNKIKAISDDYLTSADETALQNQITDNANAIGALETLVGTTPVAEQITTVTNPLTNRVKAIEDDYLKADDKTELEGKIKSNTDAIALLTNGADPDVVDGVNDLIAYVAEHGTEVTGIKADIKANADAIDAIEADYLKAADKTELSGLITGLDTRMGAAETAIGTKAAQADLETLAGRVTTAEGKVTTLEGEMDDAQAAIEALEGYVGGKKVSEAIEDAIEALKIGDYAKAADLADAVARIAQNETDIDDLQGRMTTAEGKIGTLETEVAKKANDADLAAIAKTGSTDDLVQGTMVLVFDCGTSAV